MKKIIALLFLIPLLEVHASTIININFVADEQFGSGTNLNAQIQNRPWDPETSFTPYPGDQWVNLYGDLSLAPGNTWVDSLGNPTNLRITLDDHGDNSHPSQTFGSEGLRTGIVDPRDHYLLITNDDGPVGDPAFLFSGLDGSGATLYTITIQSQGLYGQGGIFEAYGQESESHALDPLFTGHALTINTAVLSGITPNANGEILMEAYVHTGVGRNREAIAINSITIESHEVAFSAVPEPSTGILTLLFGGVCLCRRVRS